MSRGFASLWSGDYLGGWVLAQQSGAGLAQMRQGLAA